MTTRADKVIIGNEEWCAFPDLAIPAIKARVDSGAKTSALHALNIECFQRNNQDWVRFDIQPLQNNRTMVVRCEAPVSDRRWVKSSSGLSEKRYVVNVNLQLGNFLWQVELTLTNRDSMGYRMLLGRNAMKNHVLVDPARGCYLGDKSAAEIATLYAVPAANGSGLQIGILGSKADLYGNKCLLEVARQRGHQVQFIDLKKASLQFSDTGASCRQDNAIIPVPDIIIPRFPASQSYYGCSLLQHFQLLGAMAMNSANAIRQARDCISILHIMQQQHIPVLAHRFCPPGDASEAIIQQLGGFPVLAKAFHQDLDKPFVLANSMTDIEAVNCDSATSLMLQEHAGLRYQPLVRSVVLENRILASIEMQPKITGVETLNNVCREVNLHEEEQLLVIRAAQAMNLTLAGIDIIRTARGTVFFGLTPNPGFSEADKAANIHIAQNIIMNIEEKFQHKVKQHA